MENSDKIFGEYRILQPLGEGQYTKVFIAQKDNEPKVALKIFHGLYISDPTFRRRLEREFSLVKHLSHPNLVKYFETGQFKGFPYIAMENLGEKTLQRLLKYHEIAPVAIAVSVMEQVLTGLAFLHSNGIIHRDIKPSAIFLSESGKVILADFDIAKPYDDDNLTRKGAILGSPKYMAPEQKLGERTSPKSDVYSAGIVFYEMVTGQTPWKDKDFLPTDRRAWATLTHPSELNTNIPPEIDKFILKAIDLQPGRRFKSAQEMLIELKKFRHASQSDLQDWINGRRVPNISIQEKEINAKPSKPPKKQNKWVPLLVTLVMVAVLVVGALAFNLLFPSAYFVEDFSNSQTTRSQWTQVYGKWTQEQGIYSCQIDENGCMALVNESLSGNFSVNVDIRVDNGTDSAIFFGELDKQNSYLLLLRSNPKNQLSIIQMVHGQPNDVAQTSLSLLNGEWYNVQISISGRSVNIKIDNQVVLQTTIPDSAPDFQGRVGLGIPTNTDGVVSAASFDNFEIILRK
ncbi:MAG: protein kinase [Anaerolineales bacterium]|nr:protein kinase [Anaerolineales bacterium]MCZ2287322.1 protein kinase [Anaerolineales bacterium]